MNKPTRQFDTLKKEIEDLIKDKRYNEILGRLNSYEFDQNLYDEENDPCYKPIVHE